MIEEFLEDFFKEVNGFVEESIKDVDVELSEPEDKKEGEEKPASYYRFVSDEYKNGEHISHQEKEIKNGKVLKDVGCIDFNYRTTNIEDNKKKEEGKKDDNDKEDIKTAYINAKKEIKELHKKMGELTLENHALKKQNEDLVYKLDSIKKIF